MQKKSSTAAITSNNAKRSDNLIELFLASQCGEKEYEIPPVRREIHERLQKGRISKGLIITKLYSAAVLVVYRPRILTYRRTVITALPLSTSVPSLFVSANSLCDIHPCRRFGAPVTLLAIWHLSASSPLRRHSRPSISSTTSSQCAIVKLFSRKKRAISLARVIYRSRVARNRDKNSTAFV